MRVYSVLKEKCASILEIADYNIIYGLFSKSGSDKRLMELAGQNKDIILVNEEELLFHK